MQLFCPAKVNLALSVGKVQPDGLHPIASWMVAVEFGDALMLAKAPDHKSHFSIHFATESLTPQQVDWPLERDLCFRAHGLLEQHLGHRLAVTVVLDKSIPTGSGLGGGSSNAAGMLVGLNRLFELDLDQDALLHLAARLGSDVPFAIAALNGQTSVIATGLGQKLEPVELSRPIHLVLVLAPFSCATRDVYKTFDHLSATATTVDEPRVHRLANVPLMTPEGLFNDLLESAWRVQPQLMRSMDLLRQQMNQPIYLTGSGSAMFLIAPTANLAQAVAEEVRATTGLPAVVTRTLAGG